MRVSFHNNHCCGMRSVYDFGHAGPVPRKLREFQAKFEIGSEGYYDQGHEQQRNILMEVVLTDNQLHAIDPVTGRTWVDVLREKGFRRVSRFRNDNSGNICNVFHWLPRKRTARENDNDPWLAGRQAAPRRRRPNPA